MTVQSVGIHYFQYKLTVDDICLQVIHDKSNVLLKATLVVS